LPKALHRSIMKKITKDTLLSEILRYPKSEKILAQFNVPCLTCPAAQIEMNWLKIGDICKAYRININTLLEELNKQIDKKK